MRKMRQNVILKSISRKPIIAILLTLLIGLISYGFVGKAVETILVYRETNRLEGYYRSIGYVAKDWEVEDKHKYSEVADIIRESGDLAYDDLVVSTSAVMHDYYNVDFDYGTMDVVETEHQAKSSWAGEGVNNLDYWFYGTLVSYDKQYAEEDGEEFFAGYLMIFEIDEVLAGYPERIQAGKNYVIWIPARLTAEIDQMAPHLDKMSEGKSYLIRAWHHPIATLNHWVSGLLVNVANSRETFNLKALDGDDLWFVELEKNERLDLTLPEYKKLKLELDRLNENLRAITLVGSSDMSAMPEMQLDMKWNYLVDGRWLNHQDHLDGNNVIVISEPLAKARKIKIGDQILLTMRSLQDPYYAYIRSEEDIENWQNYPSQEISYEVVGIYSNEGFLYGKQAYFSDSYVPASTIPEDCVMPVFSSSLKDKNLAYNFVLKNPRLQDDFIEEFDSKVKDLGLKIEFVDNNGRNFIAGADPLRRSTLISMFLYMIAMLLAVALTIFLYLRQHRKEYATMRALGVPVKNGTRQLIFPLLSLGVLGSTVGSLLSWENAHVKAAESLSHLALPSGVTPELSLNPIWGLVFWLIIIFMLILGTFLGNKKMSSRPVLELLQVEQNRKKEKPQKDEQERQDENVLAFNKDNLAQLTMVPLEKNANPDNVVREYSRLSLFRAPVKSLLTIIVAAGLLLAMGWIQSLINSNEKEIERLYQSTQVEIDIKASTGENDKEFYTNQIDRELVENLQASDYVSDVYLSAAFVPERILNENSGEFEQIVPYDIVAMNNLEIGLRSRLKLFGEINWLSGFGPEEISKTWSKEKDLEKPVPLIITNFHKKQEGWQLGDELTIIIKGSDEEVNFLVIGEATSFGMSGGREMPDGNWVEVEPMVTNLSAIKAHLPESLPKYLELILLSEPVMNHKLDVFKIYMERINISPLTVQFWDEELLAVVEPMEQNLSLMERLYPITMVISAVIGGVLCLLLVLNQAKETALLRMLGVEKGKIRAMQVKQILFLTLIGLLLGFILLISLRGFGAAQPSVAIAALVYLVGALLGALLGAIQVSNKKPMELLQVKE